MKKEVYNISPIGVIFSTDGGGTFKSLNGESFKPEGKRLERLSEVREANPLNLKANISKTLFNRNYALDQVRYEIIEKAEKKRKPKAVKPKKPKKVKAKKKP